MEDVIHPSAVTHNLGKLYASDMSPKPIRSGARGHYTLDALGSLSLFVENAVPTASKVLISVLRIAFPKVFPLRTHEQMCAGCKVCGGNPGATKCGGCGCAK